MSEGARQVRHHSVHIVSDPINQLKGRAASTHQRTLTVIGFIRLPSVMNEMIKLELVTDTKPKGKRGRPPKEKKNPDTPKRSSGSLPKVKT